MFETTVVAIATVLAIVLGIYARITFVRRSEIYGRDGKPVYRHADDCGQLQEACNHMICQKIDEIKSGQSDISQELRVVRQFMGRVEQYMESHQ